LTAIVGGFLYSDSGSITSAFSSTYECCVHPQTAQAKNGSGYPFGNTDFISLAQSNNTLDFAEDLSSAFTIASIYQHSQIIDSIFYDDTGKIGEAITENNRLTMTRCAFIHNRYSILIYAENAAVILEQRILGMNKLRPHQDPRNH
jgi:hypothetical protein